MKKRIILFESLKKEAEVVIDLLEIGIGGNTYMFGRPFVGGPEQDFAVIVNFNEALTAKVDELLEKDYKKGLIAGWYHDY